MGGVASFVSDVFEGAGDIIGDVVDAAGDAVEWVGETVTNVVESALDDPVKTAIQIAAVSTGNAWALPYIEGADVLEEGGSIEDALKGAARTYALQQGVSYAMDSFGTAGVPDAGGTTQFFDDGSSMQFFDDGSTLAIDSAGAVSSSPATDFGFTGSEAGMVSAPGAEVNPVAEAGAAKITPIAGTENLVEAGTQFFDDGSSLMTDATGAVTSTAAPDFYSMEELIASLDQGPAVELAAMAPEALTPDVAAPIIDRSVLSTELPQVQDRSLFDTFGDIAMEGAGTIYDYATENPLTTLALGAALTGSLVEPPQMPDIQDPNLDPQAKERQKRTFEYQPAAQIGATKGLEELYSAAESIYGDKLPGMLGIQPPAVTPGTTGAPPSLLGGPAAGQAPGIASLPRTYTPVGSGQMFDISTLTPEQIIQLQSLVERRREIGV